MRVQGLGFRLRGRTSWYVDGFLKQVQEWFGAGVQGLGVSEGR